MGKMENLMLIAYTKKNFLRHSWTYRKRFFRKKTVRTMHEHNWNMSLATLTSTYTQQHFSFFRYFAYLNSKLVIKARRSH